MTAIRNGSSISGRSVLVGLALVAMIWTVFSPVRHHEFVWDDNDYILANPRMQQGLTMGNLKWAFSTFHAANWHPLTWISHLLDAQLFGLDPAGHHLVNLAWHSANTLLLFLFFLAMTDAGWPSAAAAALFAVHPLHVESVAWVAERKDLLSTFWGFAALAAYLRYVRRPNLMRYLPVPAAFLLSLLSKPMLVTLPFVLLLLDHWPLGRTRPGAAASSRPGTTAMRDLIREKIPLLGLAAASCIVTYIAQARGHAVADISFAARIANAFSSYLRYLFQAAWPTHLAVLYPHPRERLSPWFALGALALLGCATLLALRAYRRKPYLAVGWFWYLGTLVPVIGLIQVGGQARADRYTYFPLLGLLLLTAWVIHELRRRRTARRAAQTATLIFVAAMMALSRRQVSYWKDDITLYTHAIAVTADNNLAHFNLGTVRQKQGKTAEAMAHYRTAVAIRPDSAEAHSNLGVILAEQGRTDEAIQEYRAAIHANPEFAEAHNNLGVQLAAQGRTREAVEHYLRAVQIDPEYAEAHFNLGTALAKLGKTNDALPHFSTVVRLKPDLPDGRNNLAAALANLGRLDEAVPHFSAALRLNPADTMALNNLGLALEKQGRIGEAIALFREALRIDPEDATAAANLRRTTAGQ